MTQSMKKIVLAVAGLALSVAGAIFFVLKGEGALVAHPKGIIAHSELKLIQINYLLMLIVVAPTLLSLFLVAWRYRSENTKAKYDPDRSHPAAYEWILWLIPAAVIAPMAAILWQEAHRLDPYQPLEGGKPLEIQVVALEWKWLFIYPEQGIAAVNFVQFPEKTPIHFSLSADDSTMNSFWIPELSGQIYAMTGMVTPLHLMADGPGVFSGRAAEINGKGFADMTFTVKSSSKAEFDEWVALVQGSPLALTGPVYGELAKPSVKHPVVHYSAVEKELFRKIVTSYMHHE